jgi:hypothetical protein
MAYKVVTEEGRLGTNAAMALYGQSLLSENVFRKYREYYPVYNKGATITAVKGSAGICCFKTMKDANLFIGNSYSLRCSNMLIIKVKGFKKVDNPVLKSGCGGPPAHIMKRIEINPPRVLPKGFISFEKVKVLE